MRRFSPRCAILVILPTSSTIPVNMKPPIMEKRKLCAIPDMDRANTPQLQNHRQIGAVEDGVRSARRDYVLLRRSPRMAPILRPVSLAHRTETAYPRLPTIEQSNSQWPQIQSEERRGGKE